MQKWLTIALAAAITSHAKPVNVIYVEVIFLSCHEFIMYIFSIY